MCKEILYVYVKPTSEHDRSMQKEVEFHQASLLPLYCVLSTYCVISSVKHNTPLHFHTVKNTRRTSWRIYAAKVRKLHRITYLPYQAGLFVLADKKRQHTVGHLISPRWFHPDQIFQMTRVRCR